MNIKAIIPGPSEVVREAIIVIAGALLAAAVVSMLPPVKKYIKENLT